MTRKANVFNLRTENLLRLLYTWFFYFTALLYLSNQTEALSACKTLTTHVFSWEFSSISLLYEQHIYYKHHSAVHNSLTFNHQPLTLRPLRPRTALLLPFVTRCEPATPPLRTVQMLLCESSLTISIASLLAFTVIHRTHPDSSGCTVRSRTIREQHTTRAALLIMCPYGGLHLLSRNAETFQLSFQV